MISEEEVRHIAKLARLEMTDKEIEKMQKDLSIILNYFNLLQKASGKKSAGLHKTVQSRGLNGLRKDEVIPQKKETAQKIIAASPNKKDDYIKVKSIL